MIFQDVQEMDKSGTWHNVFQQLNNKAKENAASQAIGKKPENRNLNRYRDVVPYDHSLVRLQNSDTEYINASLLKVPSIGKKYILTQGPLPSTCKHFWQMIWQQKSYTIVMLNKVVEKNQLKCHQYWPLKGSLTAGTIKISVSKEENYNEYIVRHLVIEHLKEHTKRDIRHFHYVAWPDFGVPSSPQAFLNYLLEVKEYQSSLKGVGPLVIHCSAGIGRTGTFVLIDAALTEIQAKGDMMKYDVKSKLLELRTYRAGLIQTTEQLHFSYVAILEGANMVSPSAYSAAYYSMTEGEFSEEEDDDDDDDDEEEDEEDDLRDKKHVAPKRQGDKQDEQPGAKKPHREFPENKSPVPEFKKEKEKDKQQLNTSSQAVKDTTKDKLQQEYGDKSASKKQKNDGQHPVVTEKKDNKQSVTVTSALSDIPPDSKKDKYKKVEKDEPSPTKVASPKNKDNLIATDTSLKMKMTTNQKVEEITATIKTAKTAKATSHKENESASAALAKTAKTTSHKENDSAKKAKTTSHKEKDSPKKAKTTSHKEKDSAKTTSHKENESASTALAKTAKTTSHKENDSAKKAKTTSHKENDSAKTTSHKEDDSASAALVKTAKTTSPKEKDSGKTTSHKENDSATAALAKTGKTTSHKEKDSAKTTSDKENESASAALAKTAKTTSHKENDSATAALTKTAKTTSQEDDDLATTALAKTAKTTSQEDDDSATTALAKTTSQEDDDSATTALAKTAKTTSQEDNDSATTALAKTAKTTSQEDDDSATTALAKTAKTTSQEDDDSATTALAKTAKTTSQEDDDSATTALAKTAKTTSQEDDDSATTASTKTARTTSHINDDTETGSLAKKAKTTSHQDNDRATAVLAKSKNTSSHEDDDTEPATLAKKAKTTSEQDNDSATISIAKASEKITSSEDDDTTTAIIAETTNLEDDDTVTITLIKTTSHKDDDQTHEQITNFNTFDYCLDPDEQMSPKSSVCSGHFSSDLNVKISQDVISCKDTSLESSSAEKIVDRWECGEEDASGSTENFSKRSSIKQSSNESSNTKSVSFESLHKEDEVRDVIDRDVAGYVEEKETESSHARRRDVENRKRNLANKVDEIRKKMKNSENREDSYATTIVGLVLCVVVAGFAFFYCRCNQ